VINILLSDRRFSIDKRRLKTLAETVMKSESADNKNVNLVFCADKLMTDLNTRYLNKKRSTDVLAFRLEDEDNRDFLGEVYVNLQQAGRQAKEHGIHYREEVERLTIHGILHLLGYDDGNKADRKKMWNLQESYLNRWKM
jgi:rRNA maturation RNase YbeY